MDKYWARAQERLFYNQLVVGFFGPCYMEEKSEHAMSSIVVDRLLEFNKSIRFIYRGFVGTNSFLVWSEVNRYLCDLYVLDAIRTDFEWGFSVKDVKGRYENIVADIRRKNRGAAIVSIVPLMNDCVQLFKEINDHYGVLCIEVEGTHKEWHLEQSLRGLSERVGQEIMNKLSTVSGLFGVSGEFEEMKRLSAGEYFKDYKEVEFGSRLVNLPLAYSSYSETETAYNYENDGIVLEDGQEEVFVINGYNVYVHYLKEVTENAKKLLVMRYNTNREVSINMTLGAQGFASSVRYTYPNPYVICNYVDKLVIRSVGRNYISRIGYFATKITE